MPDIEIVIADNQPLSLHGMRSADADRAEIGIPDAEELKIASLTRREREVTELVCQGQKNKEIGQRLQISLATVSHHLTAIFRKLEVEDRTSLVVYAARQCLVTFS